MARKNKLFTYLTAGWVISASVAGSSSQVASQEAGVFEAPLRRESGHGHSFLIDIQPVERCSFGDLDVVLNELTSSAARLRLQLTVEELGVRGGRVIFGKPLERKFEGNNLGSYQVALPISSEVKVYGVFLCSVSPEEVNKAPCSDKKLLPFEELSRPYRLDLRSLIAGGPASAPYSPPTTVEPKVYFAQFLIDSNKSLWALKDSVSSDSSSILKRLGASEATRDKVVPIIDRFTNTLGSLPLQRGEQRLQMVLPFFSDEKCNG